MLKQPPPSPRLGFLACFNVGHLDVTGYCTELIAISLNLVNKISSFPFSPVVILSI